MAALSDYLETSLLTHLFGHTPYSQPTTIAIALCTTEPGPSDTGATISEVTGNGYTRMTLGRDTGNGAIWTETTGQVTNTAAIVFPTATGNWSGPITSVAILDNATIGAGNLLFYGNLADNKTVTNGDIFEFTAGQLVIQMS